MPPKVRWKVLVILSLFCCPENSHSRLVMEGTAGSYSGFRTLTSPITQAYGQAFSDQPFRFKNSTNGTANSFSFTFLFAIVPEYYSLLSTRRGGMAFMISLTIGIPSAFSGQYIGIFNTTNIGKISNHVIVVELDTYKDDEFGDINNNHVGINIRMRSIISAPAGYYDQDGQFKNLSLISGEPLRVTIFYSHEEKQLNVTLSPAEGRPPKRPLLSLNQDLSPYLLEEMYPGFVASTGLVGALHYMWIWLAQPYVMMFPDLDLGIPQLPPYPKNVYSYGKLSPVMALLILAILVALIALGLSIYFYKRHKKVKESRGMGDPMWAS